MTSRSFDRLATVSPSLHRSLVIRRRYPYEDTGWHDYEPKPSCRRNVWILCIQLAGQLIFILFPPELIEQEKEIIQTIARGERVHHFETTRCRKDGRQLEVSLSVSPIRNSDGQIIGAATILRDITDQKSMQRRLQELQSSNAHMARVVTMGQMASTLAHELNQPLSALNNYLSAARRLLAQDLLSREQIALCFTKAQQQATRTAEIIKRLRGFMGKREAERRPEDINTLIRESVEVGSLEAKRNNVTLSLNLDKKLKPVAVDGVQISQVIVNLVRNAVEAMQDAEQRELSVSTALSSAADQLEISVEDTGTGIPPEMVERMFHPFSTTKQKGMGIGLSICRDIVKSHGGQITWAPRATGGTQFVISLPRS